MKNTGSKEKTRVRLTTEDGPYRVPGYWIVEVWSAAIGRWIVQGEHRTQAAALKDQQNWL